MDVFENAPDRGMSYDEFFQENYETLQRWALRITSYDRELSEDILHDVYIRFNQKRELPDDLKSVNGYLYMALKNSFISFLRKRTRIGTDQLSLFDFELADNAGLIVDPRPELKVRDELRAICDYACDRKSKSIAASILILRFFHGYFSVEIARIVNRSQNAVEARLMRARREIAGYLNGRLLADGPRDQRNTPPTTWLADGADLVFELRARVFAARDGWCIPLDTMNRFYITKRETPGREDISHLVSCRQCLETANDLLLMPRLTNRHPLDSKSVDESPRAVQCKAAHAAA